MKTPSFVSALLSGYLIATLACWPIRAGQAAGPAQMKQPQAVTPAAAFASSLKVKIRTYQNKETTATVLMSEAMAELYAFDQLYYTTVAQQIAPWLDKEIAAFLAAQAGSTTGVALIGGPKEITPKATMVAATSGQQKPTAGPMPDYTAVKAAWTTLEPKLVALGLLEQELNQLREEIFQVLAKKTDVQTVFDAGILQFFQTNIHRTTRWVVGHALETPFPDVKKLAECQGGLIGSLAFFEALQAAADPTDVGAQVAAQKTLHRQHACLDVVNSLHHEFAYTWAVEYEERRMLAKGFAWWYPLVAAATVPVILTLWDGKQWLGRSPFYDWLRLNAAVVTNPTVAGFLKLPGVFAFDRLNNSMAKLHFCDAGQVQLPPAVYIPPEDTGALTKTSTTTTQFHKAQKQKSMWSAAQQGREKFQGQGSASQPQPKSDTYQKLALDYAVPAANPIDLTPSYTPYGVPWSGKPGDLCNAIYVEGLFNVDAATGDCLQPLQFFQRLADPVAMGFGNCTLYEFVTDGLRCRQAATCGGFGLPMPMHFGPASQVQATIKPSLIECLVANVQKPADPWLTCGINAAESVFPSKTSDVPVFTPGTEWCRPPGPSIGLLDVEDPSDPGAAGGDDSGDTGGSDDKKKDTDDQGAGDTSGGDGDGDKKENPDLKPYVVEGVIITPGASGGPAPSKAKMTPAASDKKETDWSGGPSGEGMKPWSQWGWEGKDGGSGGGGSSPSDAKGTPQQAKTGGGQSSKKTPAKIWGKLFKDVKELYSWPVGQFDYQWITQQIMKEYGTWEKFQVVWKTFVQQVITLTYQQPDFRKAMWEQLQVAMKAQGVGELPSLEVFDAFVTHMVDDPKIFTPATILVSMPEDYMDGSIIEKPSYFGWAPYGGFPAADPAAKPAEVIEIPIFIVLTMLPKAPLRHQLALTIVHEYAHVIVEALVVNGLLPEEFRDGYAGALLPAEETPEHKFIYLLETILQRFIPEAWSSKGFILLQSAFDPATFPNGPPPAIPSMTATGDVTVAFGYGPMVPDANATTGWRPRYPGLGALCEDELSCHRGCTVGQAFVEAFTNCQLNTVAAAGGPAPFTDKQPQITMPSPDAESGGLVPACSILYGFEGGEPPKKKCSMMDCPPENPNCCQEKGSSGSALNPAGVDPSKTPAKDCWYAFCPDGMNCPCEAPPEKQGVGGKPPSPGPEQQGQGYPKMPGKW